MIGGPVGATCAHAARPPFVVGAQSYRCRVTAEHEAGVTFASRGEKAGENGYFLISSNEKVSLHVLQLCNLRRRVMTRSPTGHRGVSFRCATSPYSGVNRGSDVQFRCTERALSLSRRSARCTRTRTPYPGGRSGR